jgi:hypothetical protein
VFTIVVLLVILLSASLVLIFESEIQKRLAHLRSVLYCRSALYFAGIVTGSTLILRGGAASALLTFVLIPLIAICLWRVVELMQQSWQRRTVYAVLALGTTFGVVLCLHLLPAESETVYMIQQLLGPETLRVEPMSIDPDAHRVVRS